MLDEDKLPEDNEIITNNVSISTARSTDIASFTSKAGFSINKKKMRRLMEMDEKAYESFKLEAFISKCCRELDLENAYVMYQEAKAKAVKPNSSTFCNLLSLVAGLGDQGSGAASVRQVQPPNNITYAFQVYEDMRSLHIPLQECDFTALIRCCCCNHCSDKALALYSDMKSLNIIPKLRTFYPLLRVLLTDFLSNNDTRIHDERIQDIFFVVFDEVVSRYNLIPAEREYLIAIEFAAAAGDSTRFYAILHNMMEDVLIPESDLCWETIERCFSLMPSSAVSGKRYTIQLSEVDTGTGVVQCNSEKLRSIDLEADTREQLLQQLESFAVVSDPQRKIKLNNKVKEEKKLEIKYKKSALKGSSSAEPILPSNGVDTATLTAHKGTHHNDGNWRSQVWSNFKSWLKGGPASSSGADSSVPQEGDHDEPWFDIVIDGANVGYYKQNFAGAPTHVDYKQIDQMLSFLVGKQHKPLLVLHCRHVDEKNFPPGAEGKEISRLMQCWRATGRLFTTPRSFNDDWFWLYAAVKYNSMVITNDEMRDHHFQLLSPRWFTRWKERHQVHFHYGRWKRKRTMCYEDRYDDGDDSSDFDGGVDDADHCDSVDDFNPTNTSTAVVVEDAYLQRTTVDATSSAVDIDDDGVYEDDIDNNECDDSADGDGSATLSRPVLLQWPLPYSKRMQLVKGSRFNGFYFPPPSTPPGTSSIVRNNSTIVEECREDSLTKTQQDNRWLCVFAEN